MSTTIESQRGSGGRVSASTVHHIISVGSADVIYQDTALQRSGDWLGKGVAPTQSLVSDLPRSSLGVISTEYASRSCTATVEPKNRESTDRRHRMALHKTRYISKHFSGVPVAEFRTTVGVSALLVFGYSFVALCVVTNLRTVTHCTRSEGM